MTNQELNADFAAVKAAKMTKKAFDKKHNNMATVHKTDKGRWVMYVDKTYATQ